MTVGQSSVELPNGGRPRAGQPSVELPRAGWDRNRLRGPSRTANIAYFLSSAIVLVGGVIYLLSLNARLWFFQDDFGYLVTMPVRSTEFVSWVFAPVNEHTVVWTKLWFQLLARTIGLNSYWPFAVAVVACQLLLAGSAAMLAIRITGSRWVALAAAAALMVMGSPIAGVDNLVWASQTAFVLPPALLMLWLCISAWEKLPKHTLAQVALTVVFCVTGSLASAVFLMASVGIAIDAACRRKWAVAITAPLVTGFVWLMLTRVLYQPRGMRAPELSPAFLLKAVALAGTYVFQVVEGISGGTVGGALVLAGTLVGIVLVRRRPVAVRTVVALVVVAYLEMFVVALTRSEEFGAVTLRSRYGGLALSLLIPVWAILLGAFAQAVRRRRWPSRLFPSLAAGAGMALLVALAVGGALRLDNAVATRLPKSQVNRQQVVEMVNWANRNRVPIPPQGVLTVASLSTLPNADVQYYSSMDLGPSGITTEGGQRLAEISLRVGMVVTQDGGKPPCQLAAKGRSATVRDDRVLVHSGTSLLRFSASGLQRNRTGSGTSGGNVTIHTPQTNLLLSALPGAPLAYRVTDSAGPLRLCRQ